MTELSPQPTTAIDLLARLAAADGDRTGSDTFERYVWQAKQAVRQWLTCLSERDCPLFVVCELVDDLVLVYSGRVRFLQLKTRDRGSWSVNSMCDRGIDALVRSYKAARNVHIHELSTFELWLEGPIADAPGTVAFTKDPTSAEASIRSKLTHLGLQRTWVSDFLQRLIIRPDQPTRAHIDSKVGWEMSALWPSLARPDLDLIYERLLSAATAAQAVAATPASVQAHLALAMEYLDDDIPEHDTPGGHAIAPVRPQVLSRSALVALTPPLPSDSTDRLLTRISGGSSVSLLELKMIRAGAIPATIRKTQDLRAEMEVERQLLIASRETALRDLEQLATRLLIVADATATTVEFSAASSPAAAARPAEAVAAQLLSRPGELGNCDRDLLFDGDGHRLFGYIGHLSDVCRFGWRSV